MAAGALIGMFQGWLVAYKMIPAFIVTLGGMLVFRGILMGVTKSTTISISDPLFGKLGNEYIPGILGLIFAVMAIGAVVWMTMQKRSSRLKYGFQVPSMAMDIAKMAAVSLLIVAFVLVMNDYKGIPFPMGSILVFAVYLDISNRNKKTSK